MEIGERIDVNQSYIIKGNNITISISPLTGNDCLIHCNKILKEFYNISDLETITFIRINDEITKNEYDYEYVYYNNLQKLDKEICINNCVDPTKCYNRVNYCYDKDSQKFFAYLNKSKEDLIKNITELFENIKIGQNYEIKGDDYNIKISPTNAKYLSSVSHVNFTLCENILRGHYNISNSRYITFMQIEINNTNSKTLINKIEYQAYDENKKVLNLSMCEDKYIKITHSIKSSSLFDIVSASLFQDLGIDIFNINDSFFTDVCHSYSDPENNITLKDRIKEIFQNFSLCEEGCYYEEINLENMTTTCNCKVKTDLNLEDIVITLLPYQEKDANFQIIKCYNLVFSLKGKLINIGFWIFLFSALAHIPFLFLFFYRGIKPVKEYIFEQMRIFGYINSDKIKHKNSPPKKSKNGNEESNRKKLIFKTIKKNKKNKNKNKTNIALNASKNNNSLKDSKQIQFLATQAVKDNNKNQKKIKYNKNKNKEINSMFNFRIININLNKRQDYRPHESKQILNNYTFEEAIKYDYRSICLIYYIILLSKQAIFHAFLFKSPLEIFPLRLILMIFIYSSDLALNAFFYLDDKISEKYHYARGLFLFAFSNNITVILLSTLIGFLFMTLFTNLSNSSNDIRNLFREEEEKLMKNKNYNVSNKRKKEIKLEVEKILNKFKIKIIILIIIEFSLMLFFWYYVTAFCHVYNQTQYSWLFDSFLSILSRTVLDFLVPMGLAKLYRISVESELKCIYRFVLFFYAFA